MHMVARVAADEAEHRTFRTVLRPRRFDRALQTMRL